ncbi:MAG: 3-ketoacyl-ACP reductase [Kiritimatiellae bacterium]|nr:3-ketoacyl-ACP reductase [Kiritimatiellia bacterium]
MATNRKVALVTGAARGIGHGIAKALAAGGCDLAICDLHEPAAVADAIGGIKALGARTLYCRADISDARARERMLSEIRTAYGRLNILVNNAGVAPKVRADILEATEESFERVMKINLQGPYFLTQSVARYLIEQKQADASFEGCIVNISSVSATVASPSRGEYCISKAGVSMATKLWAARLGQYDLPVYEIRPGIIKSDMTAAVQEKYDRLIGDGLCLQARWGLPEDIGRAVAMLARGDLAYSSGQVIMIDGGMTTQRL